MKILVTGGCGYKGHILIPKLLDKGYDVIAFDIQWFGNYLMPHKNLSVIKGDVRDTDSIPLDGVDCIIHLSSIANDPCSDLDPKLTWEISALATMQLADKARRGGIKRFTPSLLALSANCIVAKALISQVSLGSKSLHGSLAIDDR